MLKTGIMSNAYFELYNYVEGLRKLKKHGYECIDFQGFISPNSDLYKKNECEFKEYFFKLKKTALEEDVEIWQAHAMWPHDDSTRESREQVIKRHKKAIIGTGLMGCKYLVVHPAMPFGWGEEPSKQDAYDITIERFLKLLPTAKEEGVILCIENMPFKKGHSFSSISEIKDVLNKVSDSNMKACFDSGHCNVTGDNIYDAIKTLGNDLACLHVHDDLGRQDRHLIPFQGEIDWNGFIKGLKEIRFDGCISLETCIKRTTPEPMKEEMQRAVSGIAKYLAKMAN